MENTLTVARLIELTRSIPPEPKMEIVLWRMADPKAAWRVEGDYRSYLFVHPDTFAKAIADLPGPMFPLDKPVAPTLGGVPIFDMDACPSEDERAKRRSVLLAALATVTDEAIDASKYEPCGFVPYTYRGAGH